MSGLVNLSRDEGSFETIYSGGVNLYEEVVCTEDEELIVSYFTSDTPMTERDFAITTEIDPNKPTEEQENEFLFW